jgi:predicted secreted Zn-dependent protease
MKRLGLILSALALVLSGCTSTSVSTGYYEVSGRTGKELDRSIARNAPMRGHAFAATQLTILPVSVLTGQDETGCRVTSAKFRVDAKITMPRWKNRKGASKNLQDGFDLFADYARLHEEIHVKIGEAAAREMERSVLAIQPQKTCEVLEQKAKRAIEDVQRDHHKAQLAFDAAEEKRISKLLAASAR